MMKRFIRTEEDYVLEIWRHDFENLCNGDSSDDIDSKNYELSKQHKHTLENDVEEPLYILQLS